MYSQSKNKLVKYKVLNVIYTTWVVCLVIQGDVIREQKEVSMVCQGRDWVMRVQKRRSHEVRKIITGYILDQKNLASTCHNMAPVTNIADSKSYL